MLPPPQDVHILISGTSECVPLPGKRLCRHDEGSGVERLSWVIRVGLM